ncbi:MAG: choice-of-anchor D domain-containing protein, partial [Bdellovibrionales bacterium]|nr:choice-of-anchor D domain-containing protein [Bdellovibrionales bacterium]
ISNNPLYDFGTLAVGASGDFSFTVNNTGALTATAITGTGLAAPFTYKGGGYPGTGGTCGASLGSGGNCTVVVTYSPTAAGLHSDSIQLDYNDGLSPQSATRDIQGTGADAALLTISDGPTYNYGTQAVGANVDKTFTVTNGGGVAASSMAPVALTAPFAYKGGTYPGTGGNCGASLAASGNCTLVVTYSPTATGPHSDTLQVDYNDGAAATNSSITVQGTGATLAFLAISHGPSFDYGTRALGSATDNTFTVDNTGGVTATGLSGSGLAAPFDYKGGSFPGSGGSCTGTLAAGANCTIVVTYSPTTAAVHNDTIQVDYNDGSGVVASTRDVTGTGANAALLSISNGPTFDFGSKAVGSTSDQTLTVDNIGGVPATGMAGTGLAAPYTFKGGGYPGTGGTCGVTLANGSNCTIIVTFAPTVTGTFNDTVQIDYNNGATGVNSTRDLQGTGTAPASLELSDIPYDYGTKALGSTTDFTFTMSNTGGVTATSITGSGLAAPFEFKGGGYPGLGGTCSTTLANGANCTVVVSFSPTAAVTSNDTILIDYNDGAAPAQGTGAIQGTGNSAALLVFADAPTYDFSNRALGSTSEYTLTVNNTGAVTATTMAGAGLAAPFTFKGGSYPGTGGSCAASLVAAGSCTVVVQYSPVSSGAHSDTIDLTYNDGASGKTANIDLTGNGVAPALLTLSNSPTYNYGSRATGSSTDFTFTVDNTGGYQATAMAGSGLAAPYAFKGGGYPGSGGTCGVTLAAASNCTIVVTYSPTATGVHNDTIVVDYNDGAATQAANRDVTGTGVIAAYLDISDAATYDFGTKATGSSSDHTFTVTNSGGTAATGMSGAALTAPFSYKGGTYPGTGGDCSASLNTAGTCSIVVTYAPTANGIHTDTLTINYNDGIGAQASNRDIQGAGADPAVINISEADPYDYGQRSVGSSTDYTFTLDNSGGVIATAMNGMGLAAPYSFKDGTYPGTGGTCTGSLAAAANCTIVVTFAPVATGVQTDTIDINYNNGISGQVSSRDLTGNGVNPAFLTIDSGPIYDFGEQALGSTTEHTFTVNNTGGISATAMGGTGLLAPFRFKGGAYPGSGGTCAATLNAAASCTVVVEFLPTALGIRSDTIEINYNDGGGVQVALRAVQGTGAGAAFITITEAPIYDFGVQAVGSNTDHTFTLENTGSVKAVSMAGSGLAAPYSFKGGSYPGTGGTCGVELDKALTCTVIVTFSPTTLTGPFADTFIVDYNDGAVPQSSARNVTGNSANPALLTITDTPLYDYLTQGVGSVTDHTFTINNIGGVPATGIAESGLSLPFLMKDGSFPGTGGTCGSVLSNGSSCTIVVSFAPTANGLRSDTIEVDYNDGAGPQTVTNNVQGTGAPLANLIISDGATYDFGTKALGSTTEKTFNIDNTGGVPATGITGTGLATPWSFKGGSYPGTGGNCGVTINAGATCQIVVVYSPISLGALSDTIEINYFDSVNNQMATRDVSGTGANAAQLAISDGATYDFLSHAIGSVTEKVFTVNNNGGVDATTIVPQAILAPFRYKGSTYPGTGGTCGVTLAAGGNCTLVVEYAPTATGTQSDDIVLDYYDGAANQFVDRDITGTSTNPANLQISDGATYNFGTWAIGATTEKTFTINNTGGTDATAMAEVALALPYAFKDGSYPGTGGNCGATLAFGTGCTVVVTFNPTASQVYNTTLQINYFDGANGQVAARPITGTGGSAALLNISETDPYDYGLQALGSNTDHVFTVTNDGSVSATSMAGVAIAAPFSWKGGTYPGTGGTCNTSLTASSSCSVVVTYSPTVVGAQSTTFQISYNDGVVGQVSSRDVQGTADNGAILSVSDDPWNFGTLPAGASTEKLFTVSNTGGVAATSITGVGLAAPFAFKGGSYPGTGGTCGATLGIGGSCTIYVTYSPTAAGSFNDTAQINYWDGAVAQSATLDLSGSAVSNALLVISDGATYNYGTRATGSQTDFTFTVTNTGGFNATLVSGVGLAAPFTYAGGTFPGSGGTCTATISTGGNCTMVVRYAPTATGVHNDTIDIQYNNGASTVSSYRAVTGTGANPASLSISNSPFYDYGTQALTSNTDYTFTVTNSGGVPATTVIESTGQPLAAPFDFVGGN